MLQIIDLDVYYGDIQILKRVRLEIHKGETVSVIGANGAGKTTLVKTISGLLKPRYGTITFEGKRISGRGADCIVASGIVQVPEGRRLFPGMTVIENLEMGAFRVTNKRQYEQNLEEVLKTFPILKERSRQLANTLSGGEQQMLAIGRALMSSPRLIMFDEPSLGLAPLLVEKVFQNIVSINKDLGVTILLIEQNVKNACEISDRGYVLENGEVVLEGSSTSLLDNEHVRKAYLGM